MTEFLQTLNDLIGPIPNQYDWLLYIAGFVVVLLVFFTLLHIIAHLFMFISGEHH